MSYILTPSSSISTPVSVADGGTGETTVSAAAAAIVNGATGQDSIGTLTQFGTILVNPPASPDPNDIDASLNELLAALAGMGVIQL